MDEVMEDKKFLHLYLSDSVEEKEVRTILEFYGFEFVRFRPAKNQNDPNEYHWKWRHSPLSNAGFDLILFDDLFRDDGWHGQYATFIALEGSRDSSPIDLAFVDVVTKFLLDRYGGTIRNPNDLSKPSYLCGIPRAA